MDIENNSNSNSQPGTRGAFPVVRPVDALLRDHHSDTSATARTDPQHEPMLRQLIDMVLHHIEQEEGEFFPTLQQARLDMTPIGLQMASFEASLVHTMTIQNSRSAARR